MMYSHVKTAKKLGVRRSAFGVFAEACAERSDHRGLDGVHVGGGGAEFTREAGDGPTGEAAGDDEVEVIEVGGDVEGEAVHGDPAADADAHGADFGRGDRRGMARGGGQSDCRGG